MIKPTQSATELDQAFSTSWLSTLAPATRATILRNGRTIRISAKGHAVRRGDAPNGFYGVLAGMLAACTVLRDGRQMVFGLLEPGDWFGEGSSMDGLPRSHDILVLRDAQLLHIAPPVLEELMHDANFVRAVGVLQAARVRTIFSFFEDAALQTTRVRMARRLLKLTQGDAATAPRLRRVVPVTHELLAMMLGLTRQTMALELKALAATGAISLNYGRVVIESESLLRAIGEGEDSA